MIEKLSRVMNDQDDPSFCYANSNTNQRLETLKAFRRELRTFETAELLTFTLEWNTQFGQLHNFYSKFMGALSQSVFKKAYRRYGKQVRRLAVIEGNDNVRLHIHGALERPAHVSESQFRQLIRSCWRFGAVKFQEREIYHTMDPSDWVNYFLKPGTKDLINRSFADHVLA